MVMFCYLELGDMASAGKWLTTLTNSDRAQSMHLLVLNAKSAFFWNNYQLPEALATMRSARDYIRTASRVEKAHFLSNRCPGSGVPGEGSGSDDG